MFAPEAPSVSFPPLEIAPETFLIQQVQPACGQPLFVYINSLVIRGKEPVIVDTGTPANRKQWLEEVFTLVAPETSAGCTCRTTTSTTPATSTR